MFFRKGLRDLLKPLVEAAEPLARVAGQIEAIGNPAARVREAVRKSADAGARRVELSVWLRPPGSGREAEFASKCTRCGDCVRVCPAEAIQLDGQTAGGLPYIDADTRACVVCESLACMSNCPPGALTPTPREAIRMGTAVWFAGACLRATGEPCRLCVDACPIEGALTLRETEAGGAIVVDPLTCTGCGQCQERCPTQPKSVRVIPRAAREA